MDVVDPHGLARADAAADQAVLGRLVPVHVAETHERLPAAGGAVHVAVLADPHDGAHEVAEAVVQLLGDRFADRLHVGHGGEPRAELAGRRELARALAQSLVRVVLGAGAPPARVRGWREVQPPVAALRPAREEAGRELRSGHDLAAQVGALAVEQRAVRPGDEVAGRHPRTPLRDAGGRARGAGSGQVPERERDAVDRALGDVACAGLVGFDGDQRELVAAVPGREVVGTGGAPQRVPDAAQHLVADQVAVLVVDLLEAIEVDEDERQRRSRRALGSLDLGRKPLLHRRVIEAPGEWIGTGGVSQAGVRAGILERDGRQLGERLERVEVLLREAHAPAIRDRQDAAQLAPPVHGQGERRLDVLPGRALRRAGDVAVVLGHHRLVRAQDPAGEAGARVHA